MHLRAYDSVFGNQPCKFAWGYNLNVFNLNTRTSYEYLSGTSVDDCIELVRSIVFVGNTFSLTEIERCQEGQVDIDPLVENSFRCFE